jgi:hypothetical protein
MDKRKEYIAELMKKGYTKQQASLISMKQQGGEQVAGNTNGYSNNQKPIARILRNVETNEVKEGSLQPGFYTKVEYTDGSIDYLRPENEDMFRRMPNYINYMQKSTQRQEPIMDANPLAKAQLGIEMERAQWDKAWNSKYNMGMGITDPNSVLNYQQRQPLTPMGSGLTPAGMVTPPTLEQSNKDALSTLQPINEEKRVEYVPNRVNIMNPSGGLSLDYALNYAGRGFGSKNAWQAGIGTGLSLFKGARNFLTGFSEGKENARVAQEMQDYQFDRPRNFEYRQSGGKIKNSDVIAQNAITDQGFGNINLEDSEFVLRTDGQVQPVIGEPHIKNGKIAEGVDAQLNEGDKVISNYVKLKADDVKQIKDRYDISLNTKLTFAQAQKKIDQKLGIKKLEDEKATVLEKIEKASKLKDETTRELSTNALLKSIGTINEKLGTLGEVRADASDFIFTLQERHPKKGDGSQLFDKNGKEVTEYAQEGDEYYQQGGEKNSLWKNIRENRGSGKKPTKEMLEQEKKIKGQEGGDMYISQLAKKHNIPLERAMELVKMQMGGEQQEQGGQEEQIIQMIAEALQNGASPEEILNQLVQSGISEEEATMMVQGVMQQMQAPQEQQMAQQGVKYTEEQRASRLDDFFKSIRGLGYEGEKQIGEMQEWVAKNYPQEVTNYFLESGQPLTAKHMDLVKDKYKDVFKETGVASNKTSASYTAEEKEKIKNALLEKASPDFWTEGFVDNKWDWRYPALTAKQPTSPTQNSPQLTVSGQPKPVATTQPQEEGIETPNNLVADPKKGGVKNIMANFEPHIPLFSAIQPIAKQNVAFQRLEPIKATVEPMLAEQERMRQTDVDRIEQLGLTPQQQEALMAQGLATSQMSANDAIARTEQWNAQNQFQTDQYNLGLGAKEQIMNAEFDANHQNQTMQTLANLEESNRNQYTTQFLQGQSDRNYVTNLNKINTLSDNFAVTPNGVEYLNNKGLPVQDYSFLNKKLEEMTPAEREEYKRRKNFAEAQKRATV